MTLRTLLILGLATVTLAACSSKPAPDLYVLRMPESDAKATCTFTHTIVLDRPSAPTEYDSKRIAVMLDHNHLSYYTGTAWASPFPDQLQAFMSDAFSHEGITVLDNNTADADRASTLHLTIHEADITNVNTPVVHLRLTGSISSPSGSIKYFKLNEAMTAEENHMPQIVDAYDRAALDAVNSIIHKSMKSRCPGVYAGD